jgi:nucleotide-binding universal stress UspA family protein
MRILLAVDGSQSSDRAIDLVAGLALPVDSSIRVLAVHRRAMNALALTWVDDPEGRHGTEEPAAVHDLRSAVQRAEAALSREGVRVEGFVADGRPGTTIVDEAEAMRADLVVVGSRGHGRIATMVLGSTAAEVVDHAPCAVLVARDNRLAPIVFADDGSPSARHAESVFSRWPIFAGLPVSVVSVVEVAVPVAAGYTPGLYDSVLESYTRSVDEARADSRGEASSGAQRLSAAGLHAVPVALEGDPATEIVRFAAAHDTGTIVVGTRGHTGLARLVLGSTSRNVLLHAPCSVLVVRRHG